MVFLKGLQVAAVFVWIDKRILASIDCFPVIHHFSRRHCVAVGLRHLKSLSLRYCKDVDDWCLPKLFPLANTLQYLDLSGCHKITERGLACLYHLR